MLLDLFEHWEGEREARQRGGRANGAGNAVMSFAEGVVVALPRDTAEGDAVIHPIVPYACA